MYGVITYKELQSNSTGDIFQRWAQGSYWAFLKMQNCPTTCRVNTQQINEPVPLTWLSIPLLEYSFPIATPGYRGVVVRKLSPAWGVPRYK
jgi:hypothetical protein